MDSELLLRIILAAVFVVAATIIVFAAVAFLSIIL